MNKFSAEYWDRQYLENRLVWDIGYMSPPLKAYIDQLADKSITILVPGAGNAYEVEYLYQQGFPNIFFLDFSEKCIENFLERCAKFPQDQIFKEDFFNHTKTYDLIIEQAFFSSFPPEKRDRFAKQIYQLLNPRGKFVGLLFNHHFHFEGPPFGGIEQEYRQLFGKLFEIEIMETATNSIKPRSGREIFLKLRKTN